VTRPILIHTTATQPRSSSSPLAGNARFHLLGLQHTVLDTGRSVNKKVMASVSSLDKDLRKLRLDKYTPAAANEAKSWIEGVLGERLPSGDLLEGLKDGVALCK
jgi:hypothetical protein